MSKVIASKDGGDGGFCASTAHESGAFRRLPQRSGRKVCVRIARPSPRAFIRALTSDPTSVYRYRGTLDQILLSSGEELVDALKTFIEASAFILISLLAVGVDATRLKRSKLPMYPPGKNSRDFDSVNRHVEYP